MQNHCLNLFNIMKMLSPIIVYHFFSALMISGPLGSRALGPGPTGPVVNPALRSVSKNNPFFAFLWSRMCTTLVFEWSPPPGTIDEPSWVDCIFFFISFFLSLCFYSKRDTNHKELHRIKKKLCYQSIHDHDDDQWCRILLLWLVFSTSPCTHG